MKTAPRIDKITTDLPPCCLRIHPIDTSTVFLGTYQLEKETGLRHGTIDVYKIRNKKLEKVSSTSTLAVLDLKICPSDPLVLVLAHSTGNLVVWRYENGVLEATKNVEIAEKLVLVTSVFFAPQTPNEVLATLTSGEAAIVDLETETVELLPGAHSLECWTGGFGESAPAQNVVFTGGDDGKLIAHDRRTSTVIWETSHRHHDAGVVLILCPGKWTPQTLPFSLWTGSYDDCLRVFDLRHLDENGPKLYAGLLPQEVKKENLGGGVWRLVPGPDNRVLACCMYDGARIIEPDATVTQYFKGDHESMCYGGDWSSDGDFVVTCSFYDNVVQMWLPNL